MKAQWPNLDQAQALLFDLDGTLADSMEVHNAAWRATVADHGLKIADSVLFEMAGIPSLKTVEILNARFGWTLDPVKTVQKKDSLYLEHLEFVKPVEIVMAVAQSYFERKPMAIVSGGTRQLVQKTLQALQLEALFPLQVCAEDTQRAKPFPDPYLLAAERLGVSAGRCVVFEDGAAGIQAALAAGMNVIQVEAGQLKPLI